MNSIADALTTLRLLLVPVFVVAFLMGKSTVAFTAFTAAGVTDLIDGTIARWERKPSRFGAVLDPIADKCLLESSFICLTVTGIFPLWFLLLAFSRDTMILTGIYLLRRWKIEFTYRAIMMSKIATLCQITLAVLGLFVWWRPNLSFSHWAQLYPIPLFLWFTALLILLSGIRYAMIGLGVLRKHREHP